MRIGLGIAPVYYDEGNEAVFCNVKIPLEKGTCNSYPDSLTCSVTDALLGAAGLGGLNDLTLKDESQNEILKVVERKIHYAGFEIINLDISLHLQFRIELFYAKQIINNLSRQMFIKKEQVNLKSNLISSDQPNTNTIYCIALLNERKN